MAQYLKPDSALGYVEDNAEIECLRMNNLRHSVLGCMLGDFNEVGTYVVSPEIVRELIEMEKHLVQVFDNIELCRSSLKLDKQISFMVTFEGNRATLSLVEKLNYEANFAINSGTYSDINEYVLDSVETNGEVNRNAIYLRWNIKSTPGNVIDIFNCSEEVLEKYFGIVNRFKYLLNANIVMLEKEEAMEEIEAEYINQIFEILEQYPKLKKEVLKTVKVTLEEKKNSVSAKKPYFAKTLNEVVENAIQKNLGVLEEKEQKEFVKEKRNAVVTMNIKREDVVETEKIATEESDEIAPSVPVVKTPSIIISKTVVELAKKLVSTETQVQNRIEGKPVAVAEPSDLIQKTMKRVQGIAIEERAEEVVITPAPQRKKLEETLNRLGLGILVGVKPEKKEEQASVQPQQNNKLNSAQVANTKKTASANSASSVKKTTGGSSSAATKTKKPSATNGKTQKGNTADTKAPQTSTDTDKKEDPVTLLFSNTSPVWLGGSYSITNPQPQKNENPQDVRRLQEDDLSDLIGERENKNVQSLQRDAVRDLMNKEGERSFERLQRENLKELAEHKNSKDDISNQRILKVVEQNQILEVNILDIT